MPTKILLVDDEPELLNLFGSRLTVEGYAVTTAGRGEEAVALFQREPVPLVITDMKMPGMPGLEVIRRIKEMDSTTEVIVLTGFASIQDGVTALRDYDAFDYLTKPLESFDELLVTLSKAMERRRLRRENRELLQKLKQSNEELERKVKEVNTLYSMYETMVEGVPVGMALLDHASRVLSSNGRFDAMFGFGRGGLKGRPLKEALSQDLQKELNLEFLLKQAFEGSFALSSERTVVKGDLHEQKFVDIKAIPLKGQPENIRYDLIILEDITAKIQMEQKIQRMDRLSSLGELSAGIVHEIRNPLTAISSNAQLLYENTQDAPHLKDLVEIILIGVDRLERFMKDVLEFARPSQARLSPCILDKVVCHTLRLLAPQAIRNDVQLQVNWTSRIPPLRLDAAQIQQVLINMLLNALLATPHGGKILVNLSCPKAPRDDGKNAREYVFLSITDTGEGIAPENIQRIFDPFFTTRPSGTGLGLSISHAILREYNIDIQVDSRLGLGTTFLLKFPVER